MKRRVGDVKVFWRVFNGLIIVALILAVGMASLLAFSARRSRDAIPTVMNHKVLAVISGSMEPSIRTGDVIIVQPLADPAEQVQDGDIITFRTREKADMLITHRVIGTVKVNGQPTAFVTRGDANDAEDLSTVLPAQVVGRYQWRVPYFGYISAFIRTPAGIALFVILPGIILIGLEFRKLWQAMKDEEAHQQPNAAEGGGQDNE